LGIPRNTVDRWYRNRSVTGFPAKAGRIGSADYWFEDEFLASSVTRRVLASGPAPSSSRNCSSSP
jgi:hypothetical protein